MRHSSTTEKNILRLYGFDQTIDRISGGLVNGKDIDKITTTAPARLELRGSADAETSCLVGDGEITLVWNPSGPFTQTFRERANTTSGEIIVSNGVFKVSDFATFANVKRIVVAPDAVFDMTTATSSGALAGCTTIEVGRGGKFLLGDGAENVFTDNQLTLKLSSLGEFCLNAEDYLFTRVEVDGVLLAGGQYASGTGPFTGSGSFSVPESEVETTSVLWVGQGENVLSSTALNWEGGDTPNFLSRGLLPIFATSGVLAEIDTAMDLKGIRFAGASQEFMLRSASPESKIAIRTEGVAVEVSHKAIVDVPLEVKCDQTWNVGKNASLVISNAATMAFTYAVTNIGLGELVLCSSNNNFKGAFHVGTSSVTGGTVKVYAPENAFGPECDEELVVHMYSPAGGSSSESANFGKLYLYGTKIERPVLFTGQGNNYQPLWSATGTNIFTKSVNWSSHFRPKVSENSVLIWEGGATGHNWFMPYSPQGSENAVLCIRNRPADFAYFHLSVTPQIRLEVAGNNYSTLEFISGELVFGVDWAFNKNGDKVYFSSKLAVFDLNGYNQRIANIFNASGATVRSRSGAQLHLSQTNAQAVDSSGGIEFTGGAGLTYEGGKDFTIDLAMSSTGKVEVVSKTLRFSETGSWKKAAAVAVSGNGCIDISRRGIFGGKAAFSADGNGVFLLGEGVAQKCRSLTVGSYQVPPGRYGGADCAFENVDKTYASHFSGSGVLIVGDCSLSIVVR